MMLELTGPMRTTACWFVRCASSWLTSMGLQNAKTCICSGQKASSMSFMNRWMHCKVAWLVLNSPGAWWCWWWVKITENRGGEVGWSYINLFFCWTSESPFVTGVSDVSSETSDDGVSIGWAVQIWHYGQALAWWTSVPFLFFSLLSAIMAVISLFFSANRVSILPSVFFQDISWFSWLSSAVSHFYWHVVSKSGHNILVQEQWDYFSFPAGHISVHTSRTCMCWAGLWHWLSVHHRPAPPAPYISILTHALFFKTTLPALRGLSVQVH